MVRSEGRNESIINEQGIAEFSWSLQDKHVMAILVQVYGELLLITQAQLFSLSQPITSRLS